MLSMGCWEIDAALSSPPCSRGLNNHWTQRCYSFKWKDTAWVLNGEIPTTFRWPTGQDRNRGRAAAAHQGDVAVVRLRFCQQAVQRGLTRGAVHAEVRRCADAVCAHKSHRSHERRPSAWPGSIGTRLTVSEAKLCQDSSSQRSAAWLRWRGAKVFCCLHLQEVTQQCVSVSEITELGRTQIRVPPL